MTSSEDRNNLRIALALRQLLDIDQGREIKAPYYRLSIHEARQLAGINHNTSEPDARWRDASQKLTEQELVRHRLVCLSRARPVHLRFRYLLPRGFSCIIRTATHESVPVR